MQRKEVKEIRYARGQATREERDDTVSNTAVKTLHRAKNTFHKRKQKKTVV